MALCVRAQIYPKLFALTSTYVESLRGIWLRVIHFFSKPTHLGISPFLSIIVQ